jgi:hypothetical protein
LPLTKRKYNDRREGRGKEGEGREKGKLRTHKFTTVATPGTRGGGLEIINLDNADSKLAVLVLEP